MGLRAEIEMDLEETLEGDFGLPVVLTSPLGVRYSKSANAPTSDLMGQVLYDTTVEDENGAQVVDHKPVVTLRRTSLTRVPISGEKWAVEIPIGPTATATRETFMLERAAEDGSSIGIVRLYLRKAEQS
jgi:hypothetical protein